jgi:hypothetical protein
LNRDGIFTRGVILDCLPRTGGLSVREIVDLSGYTQPCVAYVLKEFRAAGRAHIAEWRTVPIDAERWTRPEPLYVRGKGDDVAKPRALSSAERKARHFEREARRQETNAFNLVVKDDA